jgi:hypothetical protein
MHSTAPKKILKSALYASRRIKNQFPVLIVANVIKSLTPPGAQRRAVGRLARRHR